LILWSVAVSAQTSPPDNRKPPDATEPSTREESISREEEKKAADLHPPSLSKPEAIFTQRISPVVNGLFVPKVGWTVRLGGLATGSGFAAGPLYSRPDLLRENVDFKFSLVGSFKQYWAGSTLLSLPHLAGDRLVLDLFARHSDAPSLSYYGPGPNSRKEDVTNYRQEDTTFDARLGWRPTRSRTSLGWYTGYLMVNVGPGTGSENPSSETVFNPSQAPGIDRQPDFLRYGPYVEIDTRDKPGDPHRGAHYAARFLNYEDRNFNLYNFRRLDAWTEQYVPFFNEKRVIAFMAHTQMSWTDKGQSVPFYLQPAIGDANNFRGFSRLRYRDNNALILSAEYRWELASALDMALFTDAGRVFEKPGQIGLNNLRYSAGFGFRAKTRDAVVMRLDFGFSREGVNVWFKFYNAFGRSLFRYLF
jgi:hypothetical protein